MSALLWIALCVVALVVGLWVWLAVLPIGTGFHGHIGAAPVSCRVVVGSWFAKLVHRLRGLPKAHTAGITVLGRVHFSARANVWLIAHEIGHIQRAKAAPYRYLWRYVTSAAFREAEEDACDAFANEHLATGYVRTIAARMPKGKA